MAQSIINVGTVANDGLGDDWRAAMVKTNSNFTELFDTGTPTKLTIINVLADFPTPVADVITLAANTVYLIGDNINLGINRLMMSDNTSIEGVDSIVVTLTYTGTGDMFTIVNSRVRIHHLSLSCVSGRVINFADNLDTLFRMTDCTVACANFGLFNSTGANGSTVRFTAVSPSTITVSGCNIQGSWNTWLWETSATVITAGDFFDFGTATFDAIIIDLVLANLGTGTTLIKGAAASANINAGGTAVVTRLLTSGAGAVLSGVTVDDALWNFFHNDDVADTKPRGLLSLQGNATETVIAVAGTPVLIAGTWVVENTSQFTGTAAGRLTYDGGKSVSIENTGSFTVEPASGGAVDVSVEVAIDGTVVPNSKRTANASAGTAASITVPWEETLSTTQFTEFFVTNETTTVNILVSSAVARNS